MHPVWCTNTHHDVTSLVNHGMVKYTKTSISREWKIHFLWNKKNSTSLSDGRFWEVIVLEQRQPLINMVTILMMSAKMATSGLLKIKVFWNKGYYVIYSVYDVTNKILSHDSNYIMDVVMWPKFGNSSICIREVIITSIL